MCVLLYGDKTSFVLIDFVKNVMIKSELNRAVIYVWNYLYNNELNNKHEYKNHLYKQKI